MVSKTKRLIDCSSLLLTVCLLVGVGFAWIYYITYSSSVYYEYGYKPSEHLNTPLQKIRLSEFEFAEAKVFLEWYTLDNQTINRPPYKLFVVIEPKNKDLLQVNVNRIDILSSLGNSYEIRANDLPAKIEIDPERARTSNKFEPAFDFDHSAGESIETVIVFEFVTARENSIVELKTKWMPVKNELFAPLN